MAAGRAGVTHYGAHAVGSALRILRALRRKHETRNAVAARIPVDQSPAGVPLAHQYTLLGLAHVRHIGEPSNVVRYYAHAETAGISLLHMYTRMTYALNSVHCTIKLARVCIYSCNPGASAVDTRKIQRARVYAHTSDCDLKSRGDIANTGQ